MYRISSKKQRDELYKKNTDSAGVYTLHCLREVGADELMPICRALGTHPEGILYIGKAAQGLGRVGDLIKSLSPEFKSNGHHAGLPYAKNPRLSQTFPFERLCVMFTPSKDPAATECEKIQEYSMKYGEVPPLNANEA
jgi:hypothetical protein